MYPGNTYEPSSAQLMFSSCCGALATSLIVTPLDVVKIRMQAQAKPSAFARGHHFFYCNGLMDHLCVCLNGQKNLPWYKKPGHFTSTMDAFSKIIKYEGASSLWSGLFPTLAMAVPATIIYFTTYDKLKYFLGYNENDPTTIYRSAMAACVARSIAVTIISPLELMRTQLQAQQLSLSKMSMTLTSSVQKEGILILWRGLGATLLRDIPFSTMYWLTYESMKSRRVKSRKAENVSSKEVSFWSSFYCGAVAGAIAGVSTLPFDVIKTHRQIELAETSKPSSTFYALKQMYDINGFSSLFIGVVPRLVKIVPACAIMISTFELGKSYFRSYNKRRKIY